MTFEKSAEQTYINICTLYGYGECYHKGTVQYELNNLLNAFAFAQEKCPEYKHHIQKHSVDLVHPEIDNFNELISRIKEGTSKAVEDNFLNAAKSNTSRAYWSLIELLKGKFPNILQEEYEMR